MSKKSLMPKMGEIAPTLIFGAKIRTFTWIKNKIFFMPKIYFWLLLQSKKKNLHPTH